MCTIERESPNPISIASAGNDDKISLWQPLTGEIEGFMTGPHDRTVHALAIMPNPGESPLLASAGDNASIMLWNIEKCIPVHSLTAPGVNSLAVLAVLIEKSGATSIAAAGDDGIVFFWDTENLDRPPKSLAINQPVLAMTPVSSAKGAQLLAVSSADRKIRLYDSTQMQIVGTFPLPFDLYAKRMTANNGTLILCTDNGIITIPIDS